MLRDEAANGLLKPRMQYGSWRSETGNAERPSTPRSSYISRLPLKSPILDVYIRLARYDDATALWRPRIYIYIYTCVIQIYMYMHRSMCLILRIIILPLSSRSIPISIGIVYRFAGRKFDSLVTHVLRAGRRYAWYFSYARDTRDGTFRSSNPA